jgi:peptidyl-prolyl cis-trans isomerase A (cyclophilin A)
MKRSILMSGLLALTILLGAHSAATAAGISASTLEYQTVVTFSMTIGGVDKEIYIGLFDDEAPYSVNNFLDNYVSTGAYTNSFFHRSDADNMVLQGGGFTCNPATEVYDLVHARLPIPLEYGILNETGTIGMARTTDPNSATSQFYFNMGDNALNFAPGGSSAGYAVFGRVLGIADGYAEDGMTILNDLYNMPIYDKRSYLGTSEFETLPLLNTYSGTGAIENYLLKINSATVTPPVGAMTVIPEPATLSLLGLGAVCLLKRKRA